MDQNDLYYLYLMNQMNGNQPTGIGPSGQQIQTAQKRPIIAPQQPIVDIGHMIGDPRDYGMNTTDYEPESRMDRIMKSVGKFPEARFTPPNLRKLGESVGSVTSDNERRPSAYDEPLEMGWSQEYRDLYNTFPQRNKGGLFDSILTSLASMRKGISQEEIRQIQDPKYYRDIEDWKLRQRALETPYIQERLERQNIRTARAAEDRNETAQDKLAIQDRHYREMDEIRRIVAEKKTGDWRALIETSTGILYLFNNDTGELRDTGKRNITPVEQAMLNAELKTSSEIEVARIRGEEARKTAAVPRTVNQNVNSTVNQNVTTTSSPTPISETQRSQGRINRALDLLSKYRGLIGLVYIDSSADQVTFAPPGTKSTEGGIEMTNELYNYLRDHVYDDKPLPPNVTTRLGTTTTTSSTNRTSAATPNATPNNQPNQNMIRVRRKSDGREGSMPRANFNPDLYEEIK